MLTWISLSFYEVWNCLKLVVAKTCCSANTAGSRDKTSVALNRFWHVNEVHMETLIGIRHWFFAESFTMFPLQRHGQSCLMQNTCDFKKTYFILKTAFSTIFDRQDPYSPIFNMWKHTATLNFLLFRFLESLRRLSIMQALEELLI